MAQTILQIAKEAIQARGIPGPTGLFAGDDYGNQVQAIAKETARDILKRADWQDLITEYTFTTVAAEEQFNIATALPYFKKFVDDSIWNRTQSSPMRGPLTPRKWQANIAMGVVPSRYFFRIRGGSFVMPPGTTAGDTIAFEYIDKRYAVTTLGVLRETFEADTDTFRLNETALLLGIRWRYLKDKGLEYGEEFRLYEDTLADAIGTDKPSETLNLNGCSDNDGFGPTIADGSWGL